MGGGLGQAQQLPDSSITFPVTRPVPNCSIWRHRYWHIVQTTPGLLHVMMMMMMKDELTLAWR